MRFITLDTGLTGLLGLGARRGWLEQPDDRRPPDRRGPRDPAPYRPPPDPGDRPFHPRDGKAITVRRTVVLRHR